MLQGLSISKKAVTPQKCAEGAHKCLGQWDNAFWLVNGHGKSLLHLWWYLVSLGYTKRP